MPGSNKSKGNHMKIQNTVHPVSKLIGAASIILALGSAPALGDLVYGLQAIEGELAGSVISGTVTLSDAMIGISTWNLGQADAFFFASTFGPGYSWDMSDLIVSDDVAFLGSIGDAVLTPTFVGGEPGYSPDWRMDTVPHGMPGSIALGLGADNGTALWNLVELGGGGNLDFRTSLSPAGAPQWQLVLIPAPASSCVLVLGALGVRRRR